MTQSPDHPIAVGVLKMKRLTKIEKLDQQFPGLADDVRKWFAQGISCEKIAELLFERYQVSLSAAPIGSFRCRRWVPEQDLLQEKRIETLAAQEAAREREIKAALAGAAPGEVK